MKNKILGIVLLLMTVACAPENDPTKKYKLDNFVPLADKAQLQQEFLPSDNIIWTIENQGPVVWTPGSTHSIRVTLQSQIQGLKGLKIAVDFGQAKKVPRWIKVNNEPTAQGQASIVLSGDISHRRGAEQKIENYEILFRLVYDKNKSKKLSQEILQFYPSKMSRQFNLRVQGS